MSNTRKPKSKLRQALAKKTVLRTHFDVAIVDTETIEDAAEKVQIASQLVAATLLHNDAEVKARAEQELATAKAKRAECFHRIYFRGLSLPEFDALVALHPPTDEQTKEGWIWNPDTFNYALLAECAVDGDLSADDWQAELEDGDRWSRADRAGIIAKALEANRQTQADAVPKD